jgi:hypothetical protein
MSELCEPLPRFLTDRGDVLEVFTRYESPDLLALLETINLLAINGYEVVYRRSADQVLRLAGKRERVLEKVVRRPFRFILPDYADIRFPGPRELRARCRAALFACLVRIRPGQSTGQLDRDAAALLDAAEGTEDSLEGFERWRRRWQRSRLAPSIKALIAGRRNRLSSTGFPDGDRA